MFKSPFSTDSDTADVSDAGGMLRTMQRRSEESPPEEATPEIKVKREVIRFYRSRRGKLETTTYKDHDYRASKFQQPSEEVPSIRICREINERGDVWRRTIKLDSWSFAEFLRKSEMFLLHTKWEGSSIEFADPFVELFFRRDALRDLHNNVDWNTLNQDREARHNIEIAGRILRFLDIDAIDIGQKLDEIASGSSSGIIQFIDLWMLYPPGTLIFELSGDDELSAYMVDSVIFEKPSLEESLHMSSLPPLMLYCWAIDYDGVNIGRRAYTFSLQYFSGSVEVSNLRYVPQKFLEDGEKVQAVLKARGQAFWAMQGPSFRQVANDTNPGSTKDESERVVVDRKTYRSLFGGWSLSPNELISDRRDNGDDDGISSSIYNGKVPPPPPFTSKPILSSAWYSEYDAIDPLRQPDDLVLLLCPKRVHAFCLRDKTWSKSNEHKPQYFLKSKILKHEHR